MRKIELLAPAGNFEKMKYAFAYGADAVYLGGGKFSMRALADNFDDDDIKTSIAYAHDRGKKAYVAINITTRNEQIDDMIEFAKMADFVGADAFIVSDLGVLRRLKKELPDVIVHISTQANVTNHDAANMFYDMGAKRIVLARELSLDEIIEIKQKTEKDLELEMFVHGAMCISYSGRCLLSNFMTGRDSNQGNCAQACRWKYDLVEEQRPGEYYPVYEDENGTYIFNSKDLSLIRYIDKLIEAGVDSFKIEGRMKSIFYVSSVVNVFRNAIDKYISSPSTYKFDPQWEKDLQKTSHREFTDGFINGKQRYMETEKRTTSSYIRGYTYCGTYLSYDENSKMILVEQRNNFKVGDELEIVSPYSKIDTLIVNEMFDVYMNKIDVAPHPQMKIYIPYDKGPLTEYSFFQRSY